jgi:transcriptional regulator with XRE-family HTH domain/tetratricopeptide (TPR) repeat protein
MSSPPNNRLREYRHRLGLTQNETAEALGAIAWDRLRQRIGVDAGMISKWERGEKRPRRLYRELFCALYEADEYQLALRPPRPAHSLRVDWHLDGPEGYLAELGNRCDEPGGMVTESAVNRREFLAGAAALISSTALPRPVLGLSMPNDLLVQESLGGPTVNFDVLSEHLREMWHTLVRADNILGPRYALGGVLDNIGAVHASMPHLQGTDAQRLLGWGAKFAESAAWLYEDLGELQQATSWLDRAHAWASRAGDESMTTWTLVGRARQALERGDALASLPLSEAAESAGRLVSPAMSAAALCYQAEAHALRGNERACQHALDLAETCVSELEYDDRGDAAAGGHGAFCTTNYLAAQRGRCWQMLGKPDRALPLYLEGLNNQPAVYQRDRGWGLAGLAGVLHAIGNPEQAATTAYEALYIGVTTGSARTVDEVLRVVPELSPSAPTAPRLTMCSAPSHDTSD